MVSSSRPMTSRPVALPTTQAPSLTALLPLWRYVVVFAALFGLVAVSASLRVECQQLRKDLDRNTRLIREAQVLQERLTLEQAARVRVAALAATADAQQWEPAPRIVVEAR